MSKDLERCRKCGKLHYCDEHHLLPKALFGDGETELLCKNCHDEFHRLLGHKYLHESNKQPMSFYFEKYYRWLAGLAIAVLIWFCL